VREELCDRNPATGLRVAEPEGDPRHARNPFSPDQLQRIVAHLPEARPHQRWIILLGMFTGARLNEICGLATADIAELEGVPIMGWTRRTMRETYGSGPRISALAEAVERVEYPGGDLGHLYVR